MGFELKSFDLPTPSDDDIADILEEDDHVRTNPLLQYEHSMSATRTQRTTLMEDVRKATDQFTADQRALYDEFYDAVDKHRGGVFFLDAPGGTGKSFVLQTLLRRIRASQHVALAVASSGIAANNYELPHTAHNAFKIPVEGVLEPGTTLFAANSDRGELMLSARLVVWDEASMSLGDHIQAVDSTMRDISGIDEPFGGRCVFIFAGDWRQTLPVVPPGTRAQVIEACLKHTALVLSFFINPIGASDQAWGAIATIRVLVPEP